MCTVTHAHPHVPSQHSGLLSKMNTLHSLLLLLLLHYLIFSLEVVGAVCYVIRTSHAKPN
jgi:hypothetical protein